MTDGGWLLAQKAELLALEAEMQGMIAENQQRIHAGNSLAYTDKSFNDKAAEIRGVANCIMKYR